MSTTERLPSVAFRQTYARLTEPVIVEVLGRPIGTFLPGDPARYGIDLANILGTSGGARVVHPGKGYGHSPSAVRPVTKEFQTRRKPK